MALHAHSPAPTPETNLARSHYLKPDAASGSDHYYLAHKPFWDKILQQRTNSNVAKRKFDGEGQPAPPPLHPTAPHRAGRLVVATTSAVLLMQCGAVRVGGRGHRSACGYRPELVRWVRRVGWAGAGQDTAQPRVARYRGKLSELFILRPIPCLPANRAKRGRVHPTVPRVERNRPHYAPGPVPGVRPKRGWHHRLLRTVRCKLTKTPRRTTHILGRGRCVRCLCVH